MWALLAITGVLTVSTISDNHMQVHPDLTYVKVIHHYDSKQICNDHMNDQVVKDFQKAYFEQVHAPLKKNEYQMKYTSCLYDKADGEK
jgi:hypothetical protein